MKDEIIILLWKYKQLPSSFCWKSRVKRVGSLFNTTSLAFENTYRVKQILIYFFLLSLNLSKMRDNPSKLKIKLLKIFWRNFNNR